MPIIITSNKSIRNDIMDESVKSEDFKVNERNTNSNIEMKISNISGKLNKRFDTSYGYSYTVSQC